MSVEEVRQIYCLSLEIKTLKLDLGTLDKRKIVQNGLRNP